MERSSSRWRASPDRDRTISWKTINQIIGLPTINPAFRQQLQEDPLAALEEQGVTLTPEELAVFKSFASLPFAQFCERLSEEFAPEEHSC